MPCDPLHIAQVACLMGCLRELREIEAAARMDADDTAYHIERLRVRWSEQDKSAKAAAHDVHEMEQQLAELIVGATAAPLLLSEVVGEA